ncbi:MAG: toprim domain-containing protein [Candidatus Bathyarchaeota archaeon]|nr:toprim domain-containing protein [Candidatus Bathyarchaeota archaeon]
MSTRLKERLEKIQKLIIKLSDASAKGNPIVVEGKKDEEALRELGINGTIITIKTGGKSFFEATAELEALGASEVILFLDFDRRGKEATKRLQQDLERLKIKVDVKFWRELHGLVGREVDSIESLPTYISTVQQKVA